MIRLRLFRPIAAVAAIAACTALASTRAASAGTFDDFRVPDHHMVLWSGSLDGRTEWGSSSRTASSQRTGDASGSANTQASCLAESDASLTTWGAGASADGYRMHDLSHTEPAGAPFWESQESWRHSLSESFWLSATQRWWPASGGPHAVVAASAEGDYGQEWSWNRGDRAEFSAGADPTPTLRVEDKDERRTWNHQVSASAGVGVGRTRDATGAYEARLLEDRLREAGLLVRPLSARARQDLAALLTVRRDVSTTHDNPAAPVWAAIQRILAADGALRDEALSAEAWFRLTEPWFARQSRVDGSLVPVSPVLRLRGWMLEARIEGRTGQYVNHWSSAVSYSYFGSPPSYSSSEDQRDAASTDRGAAGLAGEAHWPLGMRVQADASASALADLRPGQHGIDQRAAAAVNWLAAPRWLVSLNASQARTCFSGRGTSLADDAWSVLYGLTAEYAVTAHVAAVLDFTQTHGRLGEGSDPASAYWQTNNRGEVAFGLTYRFAGRASAPGLFPAH